MNTPSIPPSAQAYATLRAILTDLQFWVPVGALGFGVGLLLWLH